MSRVLVVTADQDHRMVAVRHSRELRAEARSDRGVADRARDVGFVELPVGAHVHDQGTVGLHQLDLACGQRFDLDAPAQQRSAVQRDDRLEVQAMSAGAPQAAPAIPGRFTGKVVVITGATGGIGAATTRRLAAEDATLVLTGRNR